MELKGIDYLRTKLTYKRTRVLTRYSFYEMKQNVQDLGISTPPQLKWFQTVLGWCGKSVDSMADRLLFDKFKDDNFDLNGIFAMNNPDIFFDSAILSALISACSFVYISTDEDGFPRLQVLDGDNATGVVDTTTGMLFEGYAVLERDENQNPTLEAYFEPGRTTYYPIGENPYSIDFDVNYPLLVPVIYRPDAKRPFGHSRISRACMDIQSAAMRTFKRSEIAAEFYSFPQKYVTGLSEDAEQMDKWRATMSSLLTFTKDEDGDKPTLGQFTTQSMEPHLSQLRLCASLFAGETGLTMDDLGIPTDNPSSSDAIKAAHENLRFTARKAQRFFGSAFLNVGIIAASIRDEFPYQRKAFYETKTVWLPIFEPDGASLSGIGDAILKINQSVPNYINGDTLSELTGIPYNEEEINVGLFGDQGFNN